jgi:hypothetical protein
MMPIGGALMMSVTVAGFTVIVTELVVEFAGELESLALTDTTEAPETVGVPLSEQFPFRVKPAGIVPLTSEQVYGEVPPLMPMLPL